MNDKQAKALIDEIGEIKRLLILQLLNNGTQQKDIALMLGTSDATVSRMIPKGITKKSSKSGS